jgi:hypothetical protein
MAKGRKETSTHIEYDLWLTFDYWGKMRVSKGEPDLNRGERSMFMRVKLPTALFTIPSLRASVTVDDVGSPQLDVTAIADAVKLATGLDIDVKINSDTPLTGEPEQA